FGWDLRWSLGRRLRRHLSRRRFRRRGFGRRWLSRRRLLRRRRLGRLLGAAAAGHGEGGLRPADRTIATHLRARWRVLRDFDIDVLAAGIGSQYRSDI